MSDPNFRVLWKALPGSQCIACPEDGDWAIMVASKFQVVSYLCDACFEHYKNPGWVYFIRAGDRVKIGYSANVEKRLLQLRTGSSLPLELWHKRPGGPGDEREMHERFDAERVAGEWFEVSERIERFVGRRSDAEAPVNSRKER